MGQSEGHADPIVLVSLRQRRRLDPGRLLDRHWRPVIRLNVFLIEPHGLHFESVPFATLPVSWVHAIESSLIPFDLVSYLVFTLLDFLDRPRPAAQVGLGENWIMKSLPNSNLVSYLEARGPWLVLGVAHDSLID